MRTQNIHEVVAQFFHSCVSPAPKVLVPQQGHMGKPQGIAQGSSVGPDNQFLGGTRCEGSIKVSNFLRGKAVSCRLLGQALLGTCIPGSEKPDDTWMAHL